MASRFAALRGDFDSAKTAGPSDKCNFFESISITSPRCSPCNNIGPRFSDSIEKKKGLGCWIDLIMIQ